MLIRVLIVYILGILLYGCVVGFPEPAVRIPSGQDASALSGPTWSERLGHRLEQCGLDSTTVALGRGMLLGDKTALPYEAKHQMRMAGMSHLLAVSGLHIGIIWGLLWLLLRPLCLFCSSRYYRAAILLVLWVYIGLVGLPASAVRAGLMISIYHLAWYLKRDVWSLQALCAAALLILMADPEQLYQVGFQLSFLGVAGILLIKPRNLLTLTLAAQAFTWPLCAYYFHSVPLFGWVQGLLVVPLLPFFVGALMLLLVLSLFAIPLGWLAFVSDVMCQYMMQVAHYTVAFEEWSLGGRISWYPSWWETLLLEAVMLALVLLLILHRETHDEKNC